MPKWLKYGSRANMKFANEVYLFTQNMYWHYKQIQSKCKKKKWLRLERVDFNV